MPGLITGLGGSTPTEGGGLITGKPPKKPKAGEQPVSPVAPPPPLPFMAEALDKYNQPYYGEGFQGFARKTFAKIFDPQKLLPKATKEQMQLMEEGAEKGEELLNKTGFDEWLAKWTGITGEDFTKSALAVNLAFRGTDEEGKVEKDASVGESISTAAGIAYRGGVQTIAAGLEALGVLDKVSRKVQTFNVALDEIGDAASVLPDITHYDETLKKMFGENPTTQRLGNILNAVTDLSGPVMLYNLLRAGTAGQEMYKKVQTVKDNLRASNMIYTMYWDESKKEEYFRRVQAGENPDLVMREIELPWVELAGSIIGDPMTYSGMGIIGKIGQAKTPIRIFGKTIVNLPWETVGRLPYLSEVIGIKNIGVARILAKGNEWDTIASPNVEKALEALGKGGGDETAAMKVLDTALAAVKKSHDDLLDNYGFFSPDNLAKGELAKKTVGTFFQTIAQQFRNPDDLLDTFKAFKNLKSTNNLTRVRAFSQLKELGPMAFSTGGMNSMEFMTRVIDDIDVPALLSKHGNDIPKFAEEAFGKVNKLVEEFYPSVNDMAKAATEIKTLGTAATKRQQFLAKSYNDLAKTARGQVIIRSNNFNNLIRENAIYRGVQSFYSNTLLGMRPAYAVRNLMQNSVVIWHDLGIRAGLESFATGAETLVKSAAGKVLKQDWAAQVVTRETDAIKKVLGFLPTQTLKGVGPAGRGGFGFIEVSQDVEKVHSAIITRYVVEREMEKFLKQGGLPDIESLKLPKEMAEALVTHSLETFGNVKETLKRFRADQATGFYETWRHLELDPAFKDTLRRSNLLDEMLDLRANAKTDVAFADGMNAFIKKIDDLAARTADEPALVNAENPMAEGVALVERAFDDVGRKVMNEEELNQFKALVEGREQLRLAYQSYFRSMMTRITGGVGPDQMRQFNQRMDVLENATAQGAGQMRNFASNAFEKSGIYTRSLKGEPPATLWNEASTIIVDIENGVPVQKKVSLSNAFPNVDPASLTNKEFDKYLWTWIKETQNKFWRSYTQESVVGMQRIIDDAAKLAGRTVDDLELEEFVNVAKNPRVTVISDLTKQIQDWEKHLDYDSFVKLDMKGKTLAEMTLQNVPNWKGGKSHLFNAVNAERAKRGEQAYATLDDVPFDEAAQVLKGRTKKPLPFYVEGTQPTVTRQLHENMKGGLRTALEEFRDNTLSRWGETAPMETKLDDVQEAALTKYAAEMDKRMNSARAATAAIADETRNFILHDYNKTNADGFASMFTMFHYWPSRTYMRWMERAVDGSSWAANYAKLRSTLEKVNSDQPEFYRYNVQVGKLPGLNNDPFYFNLEAALNPMYSLTGVDFNDPKRRVDWLSSAVDDMGKFGFNLAMPLQWAMAMRLYNKKEDEAGRRWLGRFVPVTQDLKSALNLAKDKFGIDLMPDISVLPGAKYGEFDPFINAQGGFDAYEEKRIGRALAGMVDSGEITAEQSYDIMYKREGAEFDEAVHRAILERAGGQMSSYFLGIGFKTRTEGDKQVEAFYQQYYKLLSVRENMSPEEYRQAFDKLRTDPQFQFADTVLLAAKGGDERDAVYAYNVLSRIPPGDSTSLLRGMGLADDLVQKFYDSKGDFSDWTPQDKERFMGAMLDLGATFALPDQATREEWNDAKDTYKEAQKQISEELGLPYEGNSRGVWDVINTYYDLKDENAEAAEVFKAAHPEIDEAFGLLNEAKLSDPVLAQYYATLDTVESYYSGKIRAQLFEQYGKDILLKQSEYYEKAYEGKSAQKAFLNQHPELRAYWKKKKELEAGMNEKILEIAQSLPTAAESAELREDFAPANQTQKTLAELAQEAGDWEEISAPMTDGLQNRIAEFVMNGTPLSPPAKKELEYLAKKYDYYNADDLLRAAAFALYKQIGQSPQNPAAGGQLTAGGGQITGGQITAPAQPIGAFQP